MSRHTLPSFPSAPFGLLLVEGGDERAVCQALVEPAIWGELICWYGSGRSDLVRLARLARVDPQFAHARSVGVVLDMEEDPAATTELAAQILSIFGVTAPPSHGVVGGSPLKTGVFMAPDGVALGAIESLCKRAVASAATAACVDALVSCVGRPAGIRAQDDKAWLKAYLAMMPTPDLRFHQAFGAVDGINPAHHAFDELRRFLKTL